MELVLALALAALGLVLALCLLRLYHKTTNGICTSLKSLEGKTALITGGTAGMGLEIAKDFAKRGARVIIACPFKDEGTNAHKAIVDKTGNKDVFFKLLDLSSLQSVREFATDILNTEDRLDLLINNAGVGTPKNFETKDGMNFIMQVNYYGHFLLTILLLPLLKKTGSSLEPARIVNTSSTLHYLGSVDLNTSKSGINWAPFVSYCNSKFSVILFAKELTRRLRGTHVVINSVDPGAVGTGIFNGSMGVVLGTLTKYWNSCFYKSPREGAQTAIHVALDEKAGEVSGELFKDCTLTRAKTAACRENIAAKLWQESVRIVRLTDKELRNNFNTLPNGKPDTTLEIAMDLQPSIANRNLIGIS